MRRASFKWGAELVGLSAQNPDKSLLGEGVDRLHITEAARISRIVYEQYLLPTTLDYHAIVTLDSTPRGKNWFKDLYDKGQAREGGIESWRMPSWSNTKLFPLGENDPGIQRIKESQSELTFKQEIEASFVTFVGRLVPEFERETHCYYGALPFNRPKEIYAGVDWGYSHPTVIIVGGIDASGRAVVLEEYVTAQTRIEKIVEVARALQNKYRIEAFFCGPDEPEHISAFNEAGLNAIHAKNSRTAGIDVLGSLMKIDVNPFIPSETKKRFWISADNCSTTISALETAHYKTVKGEQSDEFDDEQLDPVDALRYLFLSMKKTFDPGKIGDLDFILSGIE
jgi:hypothetical protein